MNESENDLTASTIEESALVHEGSNYNATNSHSRSLAEKVLDPFTQTLYVEVEPLPSKNVSLEVRAQRDLELFAKVRCAWWSIEPNISM